MVTEQHVRDLIAEVKDDIDANALPIDAPFDDSGFDSLDVASILLALKEQYGVEVPEGAEGQITSIKSILDFAASTHA